MGETWLEINLTRRSWPVSGLTVAINRLPRFETQWLGVMWVTKVTDRLPLRGQRRLGGL
jgi:hypothetical protein